MENTSLFTKLRNFIANSSYSRSISVLALLIVAAAVPLTLMNLSQEQDIRQRASGYGARFDACKRADGRVVPGTPGVNCNGVGDMFVYVSWQGWSGCSDSGVYVHRDDCRFVGANLCYKDNADNQWRLRGSAGNGGSRGNVFPNGDYKNTERPDGGMGINIQAGHTYTVALYEDSYCTEGSLNCINGINASGPNKTVSENGGACGGAERKTPRAEITINGTSPPTTASITGPTTGTVGQALTYISTAQAPAGDTISRNDIFVSKDNGNGTGTAPQWCTASGNPMFCHLGRTTTNTNTISFTPTTPGIYKVTVLITPKEGVACSGNPYVTYPFQGITRCGTNDLVTVNVTATAVAVPTATPIPPTVAVPQCNDLVNSGAQGVDTKEVEMGQRQGWFKLNYEAYTVPDKFEVFYENNLIFTTGGEVAGNRTNIPVVFGPGTSTKARVVVTANQTGTLWEYRLSCPQSGPAPTTSAPSPTAIPTATPIPPAATATPGINNIALTFHLKLGAIGATGENTNPQTRTREIAVQIFNAADQQVGTDKTGQVAYQTTGTLAGRFTGTLNAGALQPGTYTIKVKTPRYLRKRTGILTTVSGTNAYENSLITLTAGDVTGNNRIDILDYNIIVACLNNNTTICNTNNRLLADLDDSGSVTSTDYNIFVIGLSSQEGE